MVQKHRCKTDKVSTGSHLFGDGSEVRSESHVLVQFVQIVGVGRLHAVPKIHGLFSNVGRLLHRVPTGIDFVGRIL